MTRRATAITALALLGLAWLSSPGAASAQSGGAAKRQGTFELVAGRYSVNDPLFAEVYAEGGGLQGVALTAALFLNIDFYLEAKVFTKKGRLTFTQDPTTFVLLPLSVGFRWRAPLGFVEPFVGAGLDYDVYYEKNDIGTALDYAKGAHILGGLSLRPGKNAPVALTGRLRYSMVKAEHAGVTIDLGGLEMSASLAFIF